MRHLKRGGKLNLNPSHRKSLLKNIVTSLFRHGSIETTQAKAKTLRSFADKLITLGKKGDLHSRRIAHKYIRDQEILNKLFSKIAVDSKDRPGGYTRVFKSRTRRGDQATLSVVQLVDSYSVEETAKEEEKSSS